MASRVDNASNVVEERNGENVIGCAYCYDGEQGHAPVEYAEAMWIDVDGALCCSVPCAAFQSGMSAEDADRARGIAADGGESNPADGPFAAPLGVAFDDDTHEHDQTIEAEDSGADVDERFASIMNTLSSEEVEERMDNERGEE